ncbi:MAG: hypothetical protein OEO77_14155 [Acidimicrobiia bacterium]|nr:hypothetical protein [Acidimicrobiia bacterium]
MDIAGNCAGRLTSVVFDATLAGVFLATWIRPTEPPAGSVAFLLLLVLIEFILIHATVFLGTVWFARGTVGKRLTSMAFVTGLYLVFGIGFSLGFSSWIPISPCSCWAPTTL